MRVTLRTKPYCLDRVLATLGFENRERGERFPRGVGQEAHTVRHILASAVLGDALVPHGAGVRRQREGCAW